MTTDVQAEYERLVQKFESPNFSKDDAAAIAEKLDEELGLAGIAARLWMALPIDLAFSSQPQMFMVKPPGANFSATAQEHVQWTWRDHHFMLFAAPWNEPGTSMLGLLIGDADPVLEVLVEHHPDDRTLLKGRKIFAVKPGDWIDDFLSYYGAFCRLRAVSETTREKYRPEMEAFWSLAQS